MHVQGYLYKFEKKYLFHDRGYIFFNTFTPSWVCVQT